MASSTKRKQSDSASTSSSSCSSQITSTDNYSYPSRVLWKFIGGVGELQPQQVVEAELKKSRQRIVNGLSNYTTQSTPSGERLRSEKNVSQQQFKFVQELAKFMGIDEVQCFDVYCHYLTYEYRSSKKNLQSVLNNPRQCPALMVQVRDFYFSERLYLLRCLKHLLSYWSQNSQHPYRPIYATFVEESVKDDKLITSLFTQYEDVRTQALPNWESHGPMMNNKQAYLWARQNLREQCELLELILLYYKDFQAAPKMFAEFLEKCKRQGFGKHQVYKHVLDGTCNGLIIRISYLHLLIIIQCLDFELLNQINMDNPVDHPILDEQYFQKLDRLFTSIAAGNVQGILWLTWATVRHIYHQNRSDIVTRKLGHQAIQLDGFRVLGRLLKSEPFAGKSVVASVSHYLIYTLLYSVVGIFHEDSFGDTTALYEAVELVLPQQFVATHIWQVGLEDGIGTLLQAALEKFPLEFSPFVRLCAFLAAAGKDSAQKVMSLMRHMSMYTELFESNSSRNITSTADSSVWVLSHDKHPYHTDPFVITRGCKGQLYPQERGGSVIQWETSYNGWQMLHAEVQQLLMDTNRGAGTVSEAMIGRVCDICRLINNILTSDPSTVDSFVEISPVFYQLITRFASANAPPLALLSLCVEAVNRIASSQPNQVWHEMRQTGLLPFMSENLDNMTEVLNGTGLHSGKYGTILMGHECSTAQFPLTTAFLSLLSTLVKPLVQTGHMTEVLPCVLYVLREVFPVFSKWRYTDPAQRELIGEKCLQLFDEIVNIRQREQSHTGLDLTDVCVQSLLFSEAGQALLEIVATGVDVIEATQSQQASCDEGVGINLINLIKSSISILNRLLILKPASLPVSPVEQTLSSQPARQSNEHIIATVAQYIYLRYNPTLPHIAIVLLKRLAVMRPMAILACLGSDAETLRDTFLMRLRASSEDVELKVVILEFLSVSVQTQPGLIEMFLNMHTKQKEGRSVTWKDMAVSKDSCLHTLLDLMTPSKQGTYLCPSVLLRACTQLVEALWVGVRDTAMSALRSQNTFWLGVLAPVMKDLKLSAGIEEISDDLKTLAQVFYILAQEFHLLSGKLGENLITALGPVNTQQRLLYWSTFIKELLSSELSEKTSDPEDTHPAVVILNGWKNLLITIASYQVTELNVSDKTKQQLLSDVLHGCRCQFDGEMSKLNMHLASLTSALYFTLLKSWRGCLRDKGDNLKDLETVLVQTCTCSKTLIPSVQIGLLGSLSLILDTLTPDNLVKELQSGQVNTLLAVLCPLLQHSTYQLTPPATSNNATPSDSSLTEVKGQRSESGDAVEGDIKLKLHVMCLCVLRHLLDLCHEPSDWLPTLQQYSIIPSLLISLKDWMTATKGIQYVHSVFMLLQTMAWSEEGAACIAASGIVDNTCLALSHVYNSQQVLRNLSRLSATKPVTSDTLTWHGVYCQWLNLYSTLLRSLQYSFINEALDIVGVHQDRLQQAMDITRVVIHEDTLTEAMCSCRLLFELSHFVKEWRFQLPEVLNKLLTSLLLTCQSYVSLLMRPRYLLHLIERQIGVDHCVKTQTSPLPSMLQSQTSTDDVEISSVRLAKIQRQMMDILAISVSTLRSFTPNLYAILLEQNMDVSDCEPFLQIGFGRPSLDQDLDPPTFGTFLDCITVCIRLLTKMDGRLASPSRSPRETSTPNLPSKNLVQFVLENSLYIVLTQACRHLTDPCVHPRDKQLLKRELGADWFDHYINTPANSFFMSYQRYLKRGGPPSPGGAASTGRSQTRQDRSLNRYLSFSSAHDPPFFKLVHEFVQKILR